MNNKRQYPSYVRAFEYTKEKDRRVAAKGDLAERRAMTGLTAVFLFGALVVNAFSPNWSVLQGNTLAKILSVTFMLALVKSAVRFARAIISKRTYDITPGSIMELVAQPVGDEKLIEILKHELAAIDLREKVAMERSFDATLGVLYLLISMIVGIYWFISGVVLNAEISSVGPLWLHWVIGMVSLFTVLAFDGIYKVTSKLWGKK